MISVLYVDDEPALLDIGRIFLERSGNFIVDTELSAHVALQKIRTSSYDAIVSDYQMPDMDGIDFLKEVRSQYGDLPFILFSGKGREEVVIQAINNRVDFYLQKGGDPGPQFAELSHMIKKAVERRHAEEAIRASEEKYRELVENANNIIMKWDKSGKITFFNEFAQHFFGYTSAEIIGRPVAGTIVPATESGSDRDLARVIDNIIHNPEDYIYNVNENITRDGKRVWIQWWNKPLFDEEGQFDGLFSIGRDITGQKRFEETLRHYKMVLDNARDIIIFIRKCDGRIIDLNTIASRIYGYSRDELLDMTIFDLRCADSQSVVEGQMHQAAENGVLFETVHRKKDGTDFPVEANSFSLVIDNETVLVSFIRDITERKRALVALQESNQRYHDILQDANDAIFIHEASLDGPGRFLDVNDEACCLLGYTRKELLSMSVPDIDVPEQQKKSPALQKKIFLEKTAIFQTEHLTKDQRRIQVEVSNRLIQYEGRPAVLSIVRDITERRKTEDTLQQANRKLNLLSSITRHDVLNQITALDGYLELSADYLEDPRRLMEFIEQEKKIARNLKHQILFTRDYENLGVQSPKWQNIRTCMLRSAASLPLQTITLDIPDGNVEIFADPLLEKVCYNLLDNSLKYGGEAMTTVSVSTRESDLELTILFENDGNGIANNDKIRIFERGFGKNTGLGLFLTREILAITDIRIQETGSPEKGVRFEIHIPKEGYRFPGTI